MLVRNASELGPDMEVLRNSFLVAVVSASSLVGGGVSSLDEEGLDPGGSEAIVRKDLPEQSKAGRGICTEADGARYDRKDAGSRPGREVSGSWTRWTSLGCLGEGIKMPGLGSGGFSLLATGLYRFGQPACTRSLASLGCPGCCWMTAPLKPSQATPLSVTWTGAF